MTSNLNHAQAQLAKIESDWSDAQETIKALDYKIMLTEATHDASVASYEEVWLQYSMVWHNVNQCIY